MSRQQSKYAVVDPTDPRGMGECNLCGFWWPLRVLRQQSEYAGTHIFTFNSLRCPKCLDIPQPQLQTIILPPDPPPLVNSRVPNFAYEEQTVMIAQFGGRTPPESEVYGSGPQLIMCDQTGEVALVLQYLTSS